MELFILQDKLIMTNSVKKEITLLYVNNTKILNRLLKYNFKKIKIVLDVIF